MIGPQMNADKRKYSGFRAGLRRPDHLRARMTPARAGHLARFVIANINFDMTLSFLPICVHLRSFADFSKTEAASWA